MNTPTIYDIEYPGGSMRFQDLSIKTIETLQDQLDTHQAIWKLRSVSTAMREYYFDSKKNKFCGDPPKGRYKLLLMGSVLDNFDLALCGSYVEWLSTSNVTSLGREGREAIGDKQRCYFRSGVNAPLTYSISIVVRKLVVAMQCVPREMLCPEVIQPGALKTSHGEIGYISGQILQITCLLPFSMLLCLVGDHQLDEVLFTGEGWAGTAAHAAALVFLESGRAVNPELVVKAVSFSGPLCGSPALQRHISTTGRTAHHTTVNCDGVILDRLLADYQRLSPLAMTDASTWRHIYQTFCQGLNGYFPITPAQSAVSFISDLERCEDTLEHHNSILQDAERSLRVVGRYVIKGSNQSETIEQESAHEALHSFRHRGPLEWRSYYSLIGYTREAVSEVLGSERQTPIQISLKPVLSSVRIINTELHATVTFVGVNLEASLGRDMQQEMELTDLARLPFCLKRGPVLECRPGQTCKLLGIQAFQNKLIVKVSGVNFPKDGVFTVGTDFGESNECQCSHEEVTNNDEATPDRLVHPTMNSNFLSAALLRVALCGQACKVRRVDHLDPPASITVDAICSDIQNEDVSIYRLWAVLLDLEALLLPYKPSVLTNELSGFWLQHGDITQLRNGCWSTFEKMSHMVTEPFQLAENGAWYFIRKAVGYMGLAGAFAVKAVGGALLLPAAILTLPLLLVNVDVSLPESQNIATATASGILGMLMLPGFVVSTVSQFMSRAAQNAVTDQPTRQYKGILRHLVRVLGGNPHEILDEIRPLEDKVMSCFKEHVAGVDLRESLPCDVTEAVATLYKQDPVAFRGLRNIMRKIPAIPLKLCLVGRIHAVRMLLQDQFFIGFIGVHNAGKSTTIKKLFDVETNPDLINRTERVQQYRLGDWMRRTSDQYEGFRTWREEHDRENLQVYAVDYPGTTDEREKVAAITRFTAELASFFVVVLKAGHMAGPERAVVQIALNSNVPFVVVINHCDSIVLEFVRHGEARLRQSYAESLDIPESLIYFMSATSTNCVYFDNSVDAFRGVLYLFIQNMIGNPLINDALAMRLISHRVIQELGDDSELVFRPEYVAKAAMSLMSNCRPVTAEALTGRFLEFLESDEQCALRSSEVGLDIYGLRSALCAIDQLRQLAVSLRIDKGVYVVFMQLYQARYPDCLSRAADEGDCEYIDRAVALSLLSDMARQLCTYAVSFGCSSQYTSCDTEFLCLGARVLLNMQSLYSNCLSEHGASAVIAELAVVDVMSLPHPFDQPDVIDAVVRLTRTIGEDEFICVDRDGVLDKELDIAQLAFYSAENVDHVTSHIEGGRYVAVRRHWVELLTAVWLQPFRSVSPSNHRRILMTDETLEKYRIELQAFVAKERDQPLCIDFSPVGKLVTPLFERLLRLDSKELRHASISIGCGDVFADIKSVLEQVAMEINDDPSLACLVRDPVSGFLYFDPSKCFSTESEVLESTKLTYRALGRLVGLALTYSCNLSISFPITVYRILLGFPVGLSDLLLVRPTLARTLASLDDTALQEYTIGFALSENGNCAGPCAGGGVRVDTHNRVAFLQSVMKYHLCCSSGDDSDSPMYQFFIGVQHMCPRDLMRALSPVCLQRLVEVPPAVNTEDWKAESITYVRSAVDVEAADMFWGVVAAADFDECDRLRLLSFVLGSAYVLWRVGTFQNLSPRFTVVIGSHLSVNSYPTSVPHLHMLIIPRYDSAEQMKLKLLHAIVDSDGKYVSV